MIHRVSVYTKAGVIAHVQSTNGDEWLRDVVETDQNGVVVPLVRIDVELEATNAEVVNGTNGRPTHRSASVLFQKELEVVGGRVRYRVGEGEGRPIRDRAPVELPN